MKQVRIFTDGACSPNPGVGGWGALLIYGRHEREIYGGELETTNNRMEIMAAIMALEALKEPCQVDLFTDSQYVQRGIQFWMASWKSKGWRRKPNSEKGTILNLDLWQRLDEARLRHNVVANWIRGHSGHPENERADRLAAKGLLEVGRVIPATNSMTSAVLQLQ